jgi:hypothetical protein
MEDNPTGNLTHTSPTVADSIPDNPTTIRQGTSIQNVENFLHKNFVYKGEYRVTDQMQPGHKIFIHRNHPFDSNWLIFAIAKIFNMWTGHLVYRMRMMANALNGGSFRLVHVPPNFTYDEVAAMTVQELTAYENIDLDPKNTDWIQMDFPDQRNIQYHYMRDLTNLKPEDFGGYIVCVVVGPLVQSLQSTGGVSILVETTSTFDFRQPRPLQSGPTPPAAQGPIPKEILADLLGQQGCDDMLATSDNALVVYPDAPQIHAGFEFASNLLGGKPEEASTLSTVSSYTVYRRSIGKMRVRPSFTMDLRTVQELPDHVHNCTMRPVGTQLPFNNTPNHRQKVCAYTSDDFVINNQGPNYSYSVTWADNQTLQLQVDDPLTDNKRIKPWALPGAPNQRPPSLNQSVLTTNYEPPVLAETHGIDSGSKLINQRPTESILLFVNLLYSTINLQTRRIAEFLASGSIPIGTDYLYSLRSPGSVGAIAYVRLQPCGMFTTNISRLTVIAEPQLYLQFEREISPSAPIPFTPTPASQQVARISRKSLKHGLSYCEASVKYGDL